MLLFPIKFDKGELIKLLNAINKNVILYFILKCINENHFRLKVVLTVLDLGLFDIFFYLAKSYVVFVLNPPKKSGITSSEIIYFNRYFSSGSCYGTNIYSDLTNLFGKKGIRKLTNRFPKKDTLKPIW